MRDAGNVKEIRDLIETKCEMWETFECYPGSGIRQNLGTDVGLEKETIFEIAMKEVRDAGFS